MISIQVSPRFTAFLTWFSRYAGLFVVSVGCVVLSGWILDVPALKSVFPGFVTMKFNTALMFVLSGVALSQLNRSTPTTRGRFIVQGSSVIVMVIGLLSLCQHLFGWNLGIDELFIADATLTSLYPGRMSFVTGLSFVCVGISLLLMFQSDRYHIAQLFALFVAVHALLTLTGYFFGVSSLFRVGMYSTVALHTSIAFLLLAFGLLATRPQYGFMAIIVDDTAGGMMARRLLPFAILAPVIFGWLEIQGENLRLYDVNFQRALFALSSMLTVAALVYINARFLRKVDVERWHAEEQLRQSRDNLEREVQKRTAELTEANKLLHQEIQERKVIEEVLKENQIFLSHVLDMTPDLVYVYDLAAQHADFTNHDLWEMLGYPPNQARMEGHTFLPNMVHPDDEPKILRRIERLLSNQYTDDDLEMNHRLRAADGSWHWFHSRDVISKYDAEGKPTHLIGTARDVTTHQQSEEVIHESEAKFRALLESAPDAVVIVNLAGEIVLVNSQTEKLFGYDRDELVGQSVEMLVPIPLRNPHIVHRQGYANNPHIRAMGVGLDLHGRRKDGSQFSIEISLSPIITKGDSLIFSTIRDVTERNQVQRALKESEEKFRQLAENLEQVFWLADTQTHETIYLNPSFEKIWGISRDILFNQPDVLNDLIHPEDRVRQIDAQMNLHKNGGFNIEFRINHPSGETRWLWSRAFPVYNDKKEFYRFVGITEDITERKRAEQERIELQIEREKAQILSEFITDTSHDLRTPLSVINTSVYLLGKSLEDERQKERLGLIQKQVEHIDSLITQLHNMVRLDQIDVFDTEPLDVNAIICEVEQALAAEVESKNIRFQKNLEIALPNVPGDSHYFYVALRHIFTNAVQYTPTDGRIIVNTFTREQSIVIEVQDTGVGIPPDDLAHIFDRYYKANKARTKNDSGVGIGLTMAQKIIKGHRGIIEVESTLGVGSTFRIVVPIME